MLRFENVTVSFDGELALGDISFEAVRGRIARDPGRGGQRQDGAAEDRDGAGQARIRQGLRLRPGHLAPCAEQELFDIRSKIGMLFQESALFDSLNIEENVAYPLVNQKSIKCPPDEVLPRVEAGAGIRRTGRHAGEIPERAFGRHAAARGDRARRGDRAAAAMYDSPTAGLDPITAHTIMALLIKERDVSQATTLMVTHRYQDGNLMANFRYNSEQGGLEPARNGDAQTARTTFMVMKEGRLIFEGDQDRAGSIAAIHISRSS